MVRRAAFADGGCTPTVRPCTSGSASAHHCSSAGADSIGTAHTTVRGICCGLVRGSPQAQPNTRGFPERVGAPPTRPRHTRPAAVCVGAPTRSPTRLRHASDTPPTRPPTRAMERRRASGPSERVGEGGFGRKNASGIDKARHDGRATRLDRWLLRRRKMAPTAPYNQWNGPTRAVARAAFDRTRCLLSCMMPEHPGTLS